MSFQTSQASSGSTLPSYHEIDQDISLSARRGSAGDAEMQPYEHKFRRSKSMKKQSRRKNRPEITIVSSQPMLNHPAFSDGAKGSCVPPEAPPSYDEVVKNPYGVDAASSYGSQDLTVDAGAYAHNRNNFAREVHTSRIDFDADFYIASFESPSLATPLTPHVLPLTVGTYNRNQNHGDRNESMNNSPDLRLPLESVRENSSLLNDTTDLPTTSSASAQSSGTGFESESGETSSSRVPSIPSRPPVAKKRCSTSAASDHQFSAGSSNRSNISNESRNDRADVENAEHCQQTKADKSDLSTNSSCEKRAINPRKLLPPPRPPSAPRIASRPNPKPPLSSFEKSSSDNASITIEAGKVKFTKGKPDTFLPETDCLSTADGDRTDNSKEHITSEELTLTEPVYAVAKKLPKPKKPVVPEKVSDASDGEVELEAAPPIPSSRPPPEDYNDLLNSELTSSSAYDAKKEITDIFDGSEKKQIKSDDSIEAENVTQKPVALRRKFKGSVVSGEKDTTASDDVNAVENEDPYEVVKFREPAKPNSTPAVANSSSKRPPLRANRPPPPVPASIKRPSSKAPASEVENAQSEDDSTQMKKQGQSKPFDIIKRKSVKLKNKSLQLLKPRGGADDSNSPKSNSDLKLGPGNSKTSNQVPDKQSNTAPMTTQDGSRLKAKRPPPPRPALPSALQNKLPNSQSTTSKPAAVNSPISTSAPPVAHTRATSNSDDSVHSHDLLIDLDGDSTDKSNLAPSSPTVFGDENLVNESKPDTAIVSERGITPIVPSQRKNQVVAASAAQHTAPVSVVSSDLSTASIQKVPPRPARPPPLRKSVSKNNNPVAESASLLSTSAHKSATESVVATATKNPSRPARPSLTQKRTSTSSVGDTESKHTSPSKPTQSQSPNEDMTALAQPSLVQKPISNNNNQVTDDSSALKLASPSELTGSSSIEKMSTSAKNIPSRPARPSAVQKSTLNNNQQLEVGTSEVTSTKGGQLPGEVMSTSPRKTPSRPVRPSFIQKPISNNNDRVEGNETKSTQERSSSECVSAPAKKLPSRPARPPSTRKSASSNDHRDAAEKAEQHEHPPDSQPVEVVESKQSDQPLIDLGSPIQNEPMLADTSVGAENGKGDTESESLSTSSASSDFNTNNSNNKPVPKARKRQRIPLPRSNNIGEAKALYDYHSSSADDLSFSAGSDILVSGNVGADWLIGRIGNDVGLFPRNFVSFTPYKMRTDTLLRSTTAEYRNTNNNSSSTLNTAVRNNVSSPAEMNSKKHTVLTPSYSAHQTFSRSSLKELATASTNPSLKCIGTARALYDFEGQNHSELSIKQNDVVNVTANVNGDWLEGELNGKAGIFPAKFVAFNPSSYS